MYDKRSQNNSNSHHDEIYDPPPLQLVNHPNLNGASPLCLKLVSKEKIKKSPHLFQKQKKSCLKFSL